MPRNSAMMFEGYWNSICDIEKLFGPERAGEVALEFFRLGIYGERTQKFGYVEEAIINGWLPLMKHSQQSQDKAYQRNSERKRKTKKSDDSTDA